MANWSCDGVWADPVSADIYGARFVDPTLTYSLVLMYEVTEVALLPGSGSLSELHLAPVPPLGPAAGVAAQFNADFGPMLTAFQSAVLVDAP